MPTLALRVGMAIGLNTFAGCVAAMRCPSLIRLVGFLQQHGLTYQHLVTLVRCSQAQHSGPVMLHFLNGRIMTVEEAHPASKRAREDEADAWR